MFEKFYERKVSACILDVERQLVNYFANNA
jgi:hypothetical protein